MSSLLTERPDVAAETATGNAPRARTRAADLDGILAADRPRDLPAAETTAGGRRGSPVVRRLLRDPKFWIASPLLAAFVMLAMVPGFFTRVEPVDCRLARSLGSPQAGHPFGFDLLGCDYLSRTVYGARSSLTIAVMVVILAMAVAVALGALAGLAGGAVDVVISRAADVVFGVPVVLGGLVILALQEDRGMVQVALVLAALSWPAMLRLMRIAVISQLQTSYVEAARALGASRWRILRRHVLTAAIGPVLVYATALIGAIVAAEATLSFMGVGLQLPAISWGLQLAAAQTHIGQAPHLLIPGGFVMLAVLGFVLAGDAVRDALDPRGEA
ncbi:MAG: ABC transporter permease [Egibacteraceae bacterium]